MTADSSVPTLKSKPAPPRQILIRSLRVLACLILALTVVPISAKTADKDSTAVHLSVTSSRRVAELDRFQTEQLLLARLPKARCGLLAADNENPAQIEVSVHLAIWYERSLPSGKRVLDPATGLQVTANAHELDISYVVKITAPGESLPRYDKERRQLMTIDPRGITVNHLSDTRAEVTDRVQQKMARDVMNLICKKGLKPAKKRR